MKIAIGDNGTAATLTMVGRLDLSGEVVASPLATLSGSKSALFVEMADVTFIASMGLRHLPAVTEAKTLGRRGGRLVLLNPNAPVIEIIELVGLAGVLPIENGVAAMICRAWPRSRNSKMMRRYGKLAGSNKMARR